MYASSPEARSSVSTTRKLGRIASEGAASAGDGGRSNTAADTSANITTTTPRHADARHAGRHEGLITGYQRATLAACKSTPSSDDCAQTIGCVDLPPVRPGR